MEEARLNRWTVAAYGCTLEEDGDGRSLLMFPSVDCGCGCLISGTLSLRNKDGLDLLWCRAGDSSRCVDTVSESVRARLLGVKGRSNALKGSLAAIRLLDVLVETTLLSIAASLPLRRCASMLCSWSTIHCILCSEVWRGVGHWAMSEQAQPAVSKTCFLTSSYSASRTLR